MNRIHDRRTANREGQWVAMGSAAQLLGILGVAESGDAGSWMSRELPLPDVRFTTSLATRRRLKPRVRCEARAVFRMSWA